MWQLSHKHIVKNLKQFKESNSEAILVFFYQSKNVIKFI